MVIRDGVSPIVFGVDGAHQKIGFAIALQLSKSVR